MLAIEYLPEEVLLWGWLTLWDQTFPSLHPGSPSLVLGQQLYPI